MKNYSLLLVILLTPLVTLADVVREVPRDDYPQFYAYQFLIIGILAIAALLFVLYRRRRKKE